MDIHSVLNMFADPTRLRIIAILYERELTVSQICSILNLSQANTSKHLKKLLANKMVKNRQVSRHVYYFLNPSYKERCLIIEPIISTFYKYEQGSRDQKKLKELIK